MKTFIALVLLVALSGCATARRERMVWRVKDVVLAESPVVNFGGAGDTVMASIPTRLLQELMLAHLRISRSAGITAELLLTDGDDPNAFAGMLSDRPVIGINLGMVKLIGENINEYAALLGHEAAHWAKGHIDATRLRRSTLEVIGTVVSAGLGAGGVLGAGTLAGLGLSMIDASYSRDQEREADAAGIDYVVANNYDPTGAVTLFEKMIQQAKGPRVPFLASHPSDQERLENIKALIDAKKSLAGAPAP